MPVHAGTFVPFGNVGQAVSGFDLKNAENIHGWIVPPAEFLRNRSTGLEPCPCMRAITKWLAGGLAAAAKRAAHLHTFLPKLVVQAQAAAECDRSILDAGKRELAGTLRCSDFRRF